MSTRKKGQTNEPHGASEPEVVETHQTDCEIAVECPVVGIGASAGGLAAFEAFFSGMPADTESGMAFVLVQHLAPDHKSILSELVKRYTRMQVFEVEDGMEVEPNCAYIIPPNRDMAFLNGALQLLEPSSPRGQRLPIDFFFRSLAQDRRERAICIVLSGTGSDGTQGVRAVKGEGGMAMAQDPESSEYDGMPRSAIATGLVDYVLPPAEMPAQLVAYVARAIAKPRTPVPPETRGTEDMLKSVFILLRAQTGHDFSQYKPTTINRRVERRMAVQQIERMNEYVRYLRQTPAEVEALFRDLLIGVTSFFRDPEAFEALEQQVVPRLFSGKPAGAPIRVWVPGCSTGEEAYSIAVLLQERMEKLNRSFKVQVFGTDIDGRAIDQARSGVYPSSVAADISPERLARFFNLEPDGTAYRLGKNIRDSLVFSEQDVVKDPPFSRLDLISCRNLLIYMGGELQKKLIPLFHYALNPGGFLFLGTSETVGDLSDLFGAVDRKSRLYQGRDAAHGARWSLMGRSFPPMMKDDAVPRRASKAPAEAKLHLRELTERTLLQEYPAVGALVDDHGEILYLHGRTGRYLEPAPGEAGLNILKMAREGLRQELTTALHKVVASKQALRRPGLRVKNNGDFTTVNLLVRPAGPGLDAAGSGLFLVVFEEAPANQEPPEKPVTASAANGGERSDSAADADGRLAALNQELRAKEEYLQTTLEEMETTNEELRSSHEEMQSVSEEMQSANEELETSKEELQSVNEELATVNAELETKVADLSRINNDMTNLLSGTGIATIFVDHQLRIRRFTPTVTQVINLISSDVGRPVGHIVSNLQGYDSLVEDVRAVLDTLAPREIEVQTREGAWYLLRIRPYRTLDNVIEGAVIIFFDISEMKRAQETVRQSDAWLRQVAESLPHLVWTCRPDGLAYYFSRQWLEYTGIPEAEPLGLGWLEQLHPDDRGRILQTWNEAVAAGTWFDVQFRLRRNDGAYRSFKTRAEPLYDVDRKVTRWFCTTTDIEDQKLVEARLLESEAKYRGLLESTGPKPAGDTS